MLAMQQSVVPKPPDAQAEAGPDKPPIAVMRPDDTDPPPLADFSPPEPVLQEVLRVSGAELGMCIAREVMQWRSDHEQYTDCWVDAAGHLTGYYYGRPFSPYRDRNAIVEVWKRIDALGLRERYLACLHHLLGVDPKRTHPVDTWDVHTCRPDTACRAALLAVRTAR